jgi:hypothetical protein
VKEGVKMCRIIPVKIKDKSIIVQKVSDRYIKEDEIKLAIEDIIKDNNLILEENKRVDLSSICDLMFSIAYKGIIKTIENINNKEILIENIIFEVA